MKKSFDNRIIIVGSDHHNTLAAIRAFGKTHCELVVVIHGHYSSKSHVQVFSSRYVNPENAHIIANDAAALLAILDSYRIPNKKGVLFPCSDFAEMVFDSNYDFLSSDYIVPGFADAPGKVCQMMDKWEQYMFAQKHGIPMAPTLVIQTETPVVPDSLSFPCIVKPRLSALGSKSDIAVCNNQPELTDTLRHYKNCGYQDAIIQTFLKKKLEANAIGCSFALESGKTPLCGLAVKLREQLESAASYAMIVSSHLHETVDRFPLISRKLKDYCAAEAFQKEDYTRLLAVHHTILTSLQDEGYVGMFDIDYLICEDAVYLNEINYRHSGNGYALVHGRLNAPFDWVCEMLQIQNEHPSPAVKPGSFFMAELLDKMYIKRKNLTLFQWFRDIHRADAFAVFSWKDLPATYRIYKDCLHNLRSRFARQNKQHNKP